MVLSLALGLGACSPTEAVRNSFDDTWRLIVGGPSGVVALSMPAGTVSDGNVWTPSATQNYPIDFIREYRDLLFVMSNANGTLVVLRRDTLNVIDTIVTSGIGTVNDIAFANATTAYAATDSSGVAVIDLITNTVVFTIPFTTPLSGIAVAGNQLIVSMPAVNKAAIIDTRTNQIAAEIDLPTAWPTFVAADGVNSVFAVVCLGDGKGLNDSRPFTTPTISFIDIETRKIKKTLDLTSRANEGPTQFPRGLAISSSEYAFVPVQNGLLRISTRSFTKVSAIQFDSYSSVYYNAARAEVNVISMDGRKLFVFDEFAEVTKQTVSLPDSVHHVVGVSR